MPEVTGWLNTDTTAFATCPRCKAEPGKDCHSPLGRAVLAPHAERIKAFIAMPEYKPENYKRRMLLGTELKPLLGAVELKH